MARDAAPSLVGDYARDYNWARPNRLQIWAGHYLFRLKDKKKAGLIARSSPGKTVGSQTPAREDAAPG